MSLNPSVLQHSTPYGDSVGSPSTGMPSFTSLTPPGPPQYSGMGRMKPEFTPNEPGLECENEDERPVIALGRTTRVLDYAPRAGGNGTLVTIRLLFRQGRIPPKTLVKLRVKMGNIPLKTEICGVEPADGVAGEWQLQINAPDPVELNVLGLEVPLIVQTLDMVTAQIVDDVCIGPFMFLSSALAIGSQIASEPFGSEMPARKTEIGNIYDEGGISSDSLAESTHVLGYPPAAARLERNRFHLEIKVPPINTQVVPKEETTPEIGSPMVVRNPPSQSSQRPGEDTYQASLTLHGNLNEMTKNWTEEEIGNNRRLVEFSCVRERGHLHITFAAIQGDKALDAENVVSCIWWKDMEKYVITSVDTINLLGGVVGGRFNTEEKNRIRRNLQCFNPATVSKSHSNSKSFFQTLMDFPPPRPRNIEKDVKAFWWSGLDNMLEKVISKYWITIPKASDSDKHANPANIRTDRDSTPTDSPGAFGPPISLACTSSSPQLPQPETHATRTGGIQPLSYYFMPTPSPYDSEHHGSIHPLTGPLEELAYPDGPGTGSTHGSSMYDSVDSFMDGLNTPQDDHSAAMYHERYPSVLELSPEGMYQHNIGADENEAMDCGISGGVSFAAHTSLEYA